jgi:hypothetical protein
MEMENTENITRAVDVDFTELCTNMLTLATAEDAALFDESICHNRNISVNLDDHTVSLVKYSDKVTVPSVIGNKIYVDSMTTGREEMTLALVYHRLNRANRMLLDFSGYKQLPANYIQAMIRYAMIDNKMLVVIPGIYLNGEVADILTAEFGLSDSILLDTVIANHCCDYWDENVWDKTFVLDPNRYCSDNKYSNIGQMYLSLNGISV